MRSQIGRFEWNISWTLTPCSQIISLRCGYVSEAKFAQLTKKLQAKVQLRNYPCNPDLNRFVDTFPLKSKSLIFPWPPIPLWLRHWQLHWLPVLYSNWLLLHTILFLLNSLVNLLHLSDMPRTLRSSISHKAFVPKSTVNIGKRAFSVAGPTT